MGTTTHAQIIGRRPVVTRAPNWVGASVGLVQAFGMNDGSTSSSWDFGSGLEYAARFEHPIQSGSLAFGLQASYARLPLRYSSTTVNSDAKATVTQFQAVLRYGADYSFHPVYELTAGAIGFSKFQTTGPTPTNISTSTDYDPKIAIGYGFGFGLSSRASIEIVQELGTVLHQRDGLSASASSYPRIYVTRLGGRVAF